MLKYLIKLGTIITVGCYVSVSSAGLIVKETKEKLIIVLTGVIHYSTEYQHLYKRMINTPKPIDFYIDSNGGSVDAGMWIVNAVKKTNSRLTLYINRVYSMAGIITCYADNIVLLPGAHWMWHSGSRGYTPYPKLPNDEGRRNMGRIISAFAAQCYHKGLLEEWQGLKSQSDDLEVWLTKEQIKDKLTKTRKDWR